MLKKKLAAALAVVAALTLAAAPVTSYAVDSPNTVTSTTTGGGGGVDVVAGVTTKKTLPDGWINITPETDRTASNVPSTDQGRVITTFKVTEYGTEAPYTFSFDLGPDYAGSTITIYVEYEDGTSETLTRTADANGTITFTTQNKVAYCTLAGDKSEGTAAVKDTSSRSPQTGIDTTAVAGVTGAAAVAAAGVAVAIRKRVRE